MAYEGNACTTVFISISFPAWDRVFAFRSFNFLLTLSAIHANPCHLDHLMSVGNPMYFVYMSTPFTSSLLLNSLLFSVVTFTLTVISILSKLIFCPDAPSYSTMICLITSASYIVTLDKRIVSSTKNT